MKVQNSSSRSGSWGTCPVVQWLRLCSQCWRPRFDPWSGNKIPQGATKTQCRQINIFKKNYKKRSEPWDTDVVGVMNYWDPHPWRLLEGDWAAGVFRTLEPLGKWGFPLAALSVYPQCTVRTASFTLSAIKKNVPGSHVLGHTQGFPSSSAGKEYACNAREEGSIPGSARFPGGGYGDPLQCSCLKDSMDRRALQAVVHGVIKSQTWLSN